MMQLRIEGSHPQVVWLRKPTYLIGRSAACNIRIAEGNLRPIHACLKVEGDAVRLLRHEDAPIEVNGEVLETEGRLAHGDSILLGDRLLRVLDSAREAAPVDDRTVERPAITPRSAAWTLHSLSPALSGRAFEIRGSAIAGRARDCDIRLGEAHLSRHHARFTPTERGLELEDMGSANGTYVNGRRITHALLKNGDEVGLDKLKFRVKSTETASEDALTRARAEPRVQAEAAESRARAKTDEGKAKPRHTPPPPQGPTAIELQQAKLRSLRDHRVQDSVGGAAARTGVVPGSWLTVTVAVIAVAGMLWGATSFFETSFSG